MGGDDERTSSPSTPDSPLPGASHTPCRSDPFHNSRLRRFVVLAGIKAARCIQRDRSPIIRLTPTKCVKLGSYRDLAEARTMQFIAQHTSVPVPKVHCAFTRKGQTYIVMQYVKGQMAATTWKTLSEESRTKVLRQLKKMVDEMRALHPTNSHIANVDGGSLCDCRLPTSLERFGPFEDTQAFHAFLRQGLEQAPPDCPEVDDMIALHKREWGAPVFTHGDLSSLNIILRDDDIVATLDWETAGWFPPYWEYTTATQVNPRNSFWKDYVNHFLETWPEALTMETTRQRWWGAF
ncbi:hypothetical protein PMZ80_009848 [Knufia obscura]|uniref:Aminoglycoside phosphotransferase domain-containing protein n=2 Tax=Knufia TaxID=430999 RepID=A0AAN8EPG4_9EURO|nr:hypothetical protein PMZ80_009848 [Knufia obscura]KAK5955943.1 hypothetical protein OHC33_002516 [Knufia fluminis]